MPVWSRSTLRPALLFRYTQCIGKRSFSHERVEVRIGSAGHVPLDLYNISQHSSNAPLLIHLPSTPHVPGSPPALPDFLQGWPVASINYNWGPMSKADSPQGLAWPRPVHEAALSFSWILENLAPPTGRRDAYVYGSFLGAGLAASLALSESHSHAAFGVRGFVTYNGIYNWTMFLPDHRVNRLKRRSNNSYPPAEPMKGSHMYNYRKQLQSLFNKPAALFDVFASPALFFHNPGMLLPKSFTLSVADSAAIDALAGKDIGDDQILPKAPRKSRLVFPSRKSTLKIPETLLVYDTPSFPPASPRAPRRKGEPREPTAPKHGIVKSQRLNYRRILWGNTLEVQAFELLDLMQNSVEKVELKERSQWDDDVHSWADGEPLRRVQIAEAGSEGDGMVLTESAQASVSSWLEERLNEN